MTVRNRRLERAFLAAAERHASAPAEGYATAVAERLDRYGVEHGDTFDERPLDELLAELGEEGLDLGGWSVLARTVLDAEGLPPAARSRMEAMLDAIAGLGAEAHALVERARQALAAHDDARVVEGPERLVDAQPPAALPGWEDAA